MHRPLLAIVALTLTTGCPGDECAPGWAPLFDELEAPVLSVSGRAGDDVWLVGGGLGVDGIDTLAMHYDGADWTTLPTDRSETLWWVWPDPTSDQAWMVGEGGTILRWDGSSLSQVPSGTDVTLFGVWGSGPNDVWFVGGDIADGGDKDVILHWDGTAVSADTTRPTVGVVLFKVWGTGPGQLWVVGQNGTLLELGAGGWQDHSASADTGDSLLTIHGCAADDIYAVGGLTVLHFDGTDWAPAAGLELGNLVNGVHCAADQVLVVGNAGAKYRLDRASGSWADEQFDEPWDTDFHGGWIDPDGRSWAVGGNFLTPPSAGTRRGVIGVAGCPRPGDRRE